MTKNTAQETPAISSCKTQGKKQFSEGVEF